MSDEGEQMFHSFLFKVVNVHVLFQPRLTLQVQAEDSGGTGTTTSGTGSHDIICQSSYAQSETWRQKSDCHRSIQVQLGI